MAIPEGYILGLLIVILFLIFSVSQIMQGKDDIKNSRRTKWLNRLRILFSSILLIWFLIIAVILVVAILRFRG